MSFNYSFGLPLKHNFVEFVYYQDLFHPQEIDKILNFWDEYKTVKATIIPITKGVGQSIVAWVSGPPYR